ncbi:hypothetical protein PGTUg99_022335 [Puccinia graminis f. sp. tritici]|uniref:Uncharacterized protein n=3 Tax=Puccinia graminis f. sp. tritici TaxID=56615 RepID=E3KRY0_PUCGT|nr:uncharacterized protein PGTG_13274 [Puccinia graminis f. sp. tritici CRL 75-36-700-3]EFP87055.1 hypothetical protein PGTG_13274 [Puccinia graminis f. sp. tritici CRL 75-36-700-3]KAA1126805.1 hypothetical protein PGTUg99_022335 [Puccinia graminis f. sp. tritici]
MLFSKTSLACIVLYALGASQLVLSTSIEGARRFICVNTHQELVDKYPQQNQHAALEMTSDFARVISTLTRPDMIDVADEQVRGLKSRIPQLTHQARQISPEFSADFTQVLANLARQYTEKSILLKSNARKV